VSATDASAADTRVTPRSTDSTEFATTKPVRPSTVTGDDGVTRCAWSSADPEYRRYHDEEWGTALHGDRPLFEKISLEAFQAGLSWITILKRRPAFREAFSGFEIERVAQLTDDEVDALVADTRIIRNRQKILATRENARLTLELVRDSPGALDALIWSFAPPARPAPRSAADIAPVTPESTALSARLRQLGFRFVGPTTMYALMQSAGLVDDHIVGCWRAQA
jgi:DNA-3-methyladenine glycosylase I